MPEFDNVEQKYKNDGYGIVSVGDSTMSLPEEPWAKAQCPQQYQLYYVSIV